MVLRNRKTAMKRFLGAPLVNGLLLDYDANTEFDTTRDKLCHTHIITVTSQHQSAQFRNVVVSSP